MSGSKRRQCRNPLLEQLNLYFNKIFENKSKILTINGKTDYVFIITYNLTERTQRMNEEFYLKFTIVNLNKLKLLFNFVCFILLCVSVLLTDYSLNGLTDFRIRCHWTIILPLYLKGINRPRVSNH